LIKKKYLLFITRTELSDNYEYALFKKYIPVLRFLPDYWFVAALGIVGMLLLLFSGDFRYVIRAQRKDHSSGDAGVTARPPPETTTENFALDRNQQLILWVVGCYIFSLIMFHVNARYRMPVIVFFLLMASACVWYLFHTIKSGKYLRTGLISAVTVALLALGNIHLNNFDHMTDATYYNNVGSYYMENKDYAQAKKYFQWAVSVDKRYFWAYNNLFYIHLRAGHHDLAFEMLQIGIKLRPDDLGNYARIKLLNELEGKSLAVIAKRLDREDEGDEGQEENTYDPYFYEAVRLMERGDYTVAGEYFQRSAEKFDEPENTLINWAVIKKKRGDMQGAKELLIKAIEKKPELLAAKYNLANIYLKEKSYADAAKLLKEIYDIFPEYGQAWYYLGVATMKSGNYVSAIGIISAFIKRYENDSAKRAEVNHFKSWLKIKSNTDQTDPQKGDFQSTGEMIWPPLHQ